MTDERRKMKNERQKTTDDRQHDIKVNTGMKGEQLSRGEARPYLAFYKLHLKGNY